MAPIPSDLLRVHLENLQQKIYDMIHDMTFISAGNTEYVEPAKKTGVPKFRSLFALNLAQVSSATRTQYMVSYYKNTVFVVVGDIEHCLPWSIVEFCCPWIRRMPAAHRQLLGAGGYRKPWIRLWEESIDKKRTDNSANSSVAGVGAEWRDGATDKSRRHGGPSSARQTMS